MNILYLISYAGDAGTEKYVENLMAAASREGHCCHLCYAVPGALSEWAETTGFPVVQLDMSPRRLFAAARELAACCRERGVTVIHAQFPGRTSLLCWQEDSAPGCGWCTPAT